VAEGILDVAWLARVDVRGETAGMVGERGWQRLATKQFARCQGEDECRSVWDSSCCWTIAAEALPGVVEEEAAGNLVALPLPVGFSPGE
jgi:hypothetical protein